MKKARLPKGDEIVAEHHLKIFYDKVLYEPDLNLPPDFLIDNRIAVEVRGLNQNQLVNGKLFSLEETSFPLNGHFTTLLKSYGSPIDNRSWFVSYTFSRPFQWKKVQPKIVAVLNDLKNNVRNEPFEIVIDSSFKVDFHPASSPHSDLFMLGGYMDLDSGGWMLAEFDRNLKICIDQKASKISNKYERWWLLLVDHINYSLSENDKKEFLSFFEHSHPWEKIIIVDPRNPNNYFEIY